MQNASQAPSLTKESPAFNDGQSSHRTALIASLTVLVSLGLFLTLKYAIVGYPGRAAWICLFVLICSLPFLALKHESLPEPIAVFLKGYALFVAIYLAIEPFELPILPNVYSNKPSIAFLYDYGRFFALGTAIAAFFRPGFLLPALVFLWAIRKLHPFVTGFHFSLTDIENVVEVPSLVALSCMAIHVARGFYSQTTVSEQKISEFDAGLRVGATGVLVVAVGSHLGNYFYSAGAKVLLDGGLLSWVLDNQTYLAVPISMEKGAFPFSASESVAQVVYSFLKLAVVPLNVVSLVAELAALIAFVNRRVLMALMVVFELFHLGVYLAYGLLFIKWMALNAIILFTFGRMKDGVLTLPLKVLGTLAVVCSNLIFTTAHLGWYDSPAFLSVFFEATTAEGKTYRVPSAFFRSASYQVSHGHFYVPKGGEHFPFTTWGSFKNYEDLKAARRCQVPARAVTNEETFGPLENVKAYVRQNHRDVIKGLSADGRFNYFAYPHHHYPAPFYNSEFYSLDPRRIVSYNYVLESVCLELVSGHLKRHVLYRSEFPIPLDSASDAQE